jgi:galactoside O-acetyltransferase
VIRFLKSEIVEWGNIFFSILPGKIGVLFRSFWWQFFFKKCNRINIGMSCNFISPANISFIGTIWIGDRCFFSAEGGEIFVDDLASFNMGGHINASCGGTIKIGKRCLIGPGVVMRTANHRISSEGLSIQGQGHDIGDINIEDDCWLGAYSVILKDVRIGRGAVIGAGAIVTRDIPSMAIAVGNPAKVIKYRDDK